MFACKYIRWWIPKIFTYPVKAIDWQFEKNIEKADEMFTKFFFISSNPEDLENSRLSLSS